MPTKKLIEVALPLDDINAASAREKSIRHGHPSTLHLWWARRPLAACRAVLFASLVDDPDQEGVPPELLAEIDRLLAPELPDWQELPLGEQRRQRLFRFIKTLVQWESSTDERVLATARRLIHAATGGNPPPVYDPFAGGGSIPLEAQRLGLEAHASDLNPVAVLINKALIEIPPKFANLPPVNPINRNQIGAEWKGAAGLAADVRYYGKWMRDEAERRIGHLYPKVKLPKEHGGGEATVIAWLWARTITCPNPACGAKMPLIRSFTLSSAKRDNFHVQYKIDNQHLPPVVQFDGASGSAESIEGTVSRKGAICLACKTTLSLESIRQAGKSKQISLKLMAVVAEGRRRRIYVSPRNVNLPEVPETEFLDNLPAAEISGYFNPPLYSYDTIGSLFIPRQRLTYRPEVRAMKRDRRRLVHSSPRTRISNGMHRSLAVSSTRGMRLGDATIPSNSRAACTHFMLCSTHAAAPQVRKCTSSTVLDVLPFRGDEACRRRWKLVFECRQEVRNLKHGLGFHRHTVNNDRRFALLNE
jgi:putative DNA methylase